MARQLLQIVGMTHPVHFHVAMPEQPRNRLTVGFRAILAIPNAIVVGGPMLGIFGGGYRTGVLGLTALVMALFDWVAVIFTGRAVPSVQHYKQDYLSWRCRALAYMALLRDEFPPLGQGNYPAALELTVPYGTRNRVEIAFRPILIIPQIVVLFLLLVAWLVVAIVSWAEIMVVGRLSPWLWHFGHRVMRYLLRVETYALLVHDHYPPFSLVDEGERIRSAGAKGEPVPVH
jgi:hypothetical protein